MGLSHHISNSMITARDIFERLVISWLRVICDIANHSVRGADIECSVPDSTDWAIVVLSFTAYYLVCHFIHMRFEGWIRSIERNNSQSKILDNDSSNTNK